MNETTKYLERLAKINKDHNKRSIWDSIDRPIRPLVFELNRIGMQTKFSCCGFTYEGEDQDDPKTHWIKSNKAYVHFFAFNTDECKKNFQILKTIIEACKCDIYLFVNVWNLNISFDNTENWYNKPDGIPESIHQYEMAALKISNLVYNIKNSIPTINDPVTIIDGNNYYTKIPHWQIKPKLNHIISVEQYYKENTEYNNYENLEPSNLYLG